MVQALGDLLEDHQIDFASEFGDAVRVRCGDIDERLQELDHPRRVTGHRVGIDRRHLRGVAFGDGLGEFQRGKPVTYFRSMFMCSTRLSN